MGLETMMIAGLAISAGTTVMSGIASSNQAKYEADVARNNAIMARQQAALDANRMRRDTARRLGAQKTGFAASGVTLTGSALDVAEDTGRIGEEDAQLVLYGGAGRATNYEAQARGAKSRATASLFSGIAGGASTALTGASQYKLAFG